MPSVARGVVENQQQTANSYQQEPPYEGASATTGNGGGTYNRRGGDGGSNYEAHDYYNKQQQEYAYYKQRSGSSSSSTTAGGLPSPRMDSEDMDDEAVDFGSFRHGTQKQEVVAVDNSMAGFPQATQQQMWRSETLTNGDVHA